MMANVEGHTVLEAQVNDGKVHTTGKGRDPWGDLLERGRYLNRAGNLGGRFMCVLRPESS
jgi:hypothetical protein